MSQKVSFTLNGKKIEVDKGLTIWEIANGQGIKIPHLCHSLLQLIDQTETAAHVWLK